MKEYKEYLFVDVPEDYWCFHIEEVTNCVQAFPKDGGGGRKPFGWWNQLPEGDWSIVGIAGELSEGEAAQIVEFSYNEDPMLRFPKDYLTNNYDCDTATESLSSLLSSLGMKSNCLILKRK